EAGQDVCRLVQTQRDDRELVVIPIRLVNRLEVGQLSDARSAPRRPEIEQHDLSLEFVERQQLAVQRLHIELRPPLTDLQRLIPPLTRWKRAEIERTVAWLSIHTDLVRERPDQTAPAAGVVWRLLVDVDTEHIIPRLHVLGAEAAVLEHPHADRRRLTLRNL